MKARLIDRATGMDGRPRITLELLEPGGGEIPAGELRVEIKPWRNRRSLDANAYAWVLIDRIAEATGATREEVYRAAIRCIGGVSEIVCVKTQAVERLRESWSRNGIGWQTDTMPSRLPGCTNVVLWFGSSTYDAKQMSRLIELLVFDAKSLGIETMTPEELARLEGLG